jgi:hypothetical protein
MIAFKIGVQADRRAGEDNGRQSGSHRTFEARIDGCPGPIDHRLYMSKSTRDSESIPSIVPNGTDSSHLTRPSNKLLGYCHSVPAGQGRPY